jgi:hypothetical protein
VSLDELPLRVIEEMTGTVLYIDRPEETPVVLYAIQQGGGTDAIPDPDLHDVTAREFV